MAPTVKGPEAIDFAVEALRSGQIVSFPTETVYGLGANALDGLAVAKIFEMKGRPQFNPLIVHIATIEDAEKLGVFNEDARKLATIFWPGALTIVVPKASGGNVSDLVTAGLETIAIRIPKHPLAQKLLKSAGFPVAAPSANVSGHVSPTTALHVAKDFHSKDLLILDGGPTGFGIESTIVSCAGDEVYLLRAGAVTEDEIEDALGKKIGTPHKVDKHPISPGQLLSHYATKSPIRLNATEVSEEELLLALGSGIPEGARRVLNLSPDGDLREAAANLFAMLRELDEGADSTIAVMPIPETGLGVAINDRLRRAAAPRLQDKNDSSVY